MKPHRNILTAGLAALCAFGANADAASVISRLTPPSALFTFGDATPPIIARFLPGQRFDLQCTVRPDAGLTVSSEAFAVDGKLPRSVLVVSVETVYYQCSKALVRSKLWDPAACIQRSALPSTGTMIGDISRGSIDAETYDRELPARIQAQLY